MRYIPVFASKLEHPTIYVHIALSRRNKTPDPKIHGDDVTA
jgi:hypothetical protein